MIMGRECNLLIKYYRSYSTFRNIFNTLVISLLVSIILLAFILSAVFSSVLTRQTNDISTRMLSRLTFMINQIYTDAYSIMLSLGYGENVDLNTMMFSESRDRLRDYSGFTRMRLLQTIYPGIAYIGVYNGIGLQAPVVAAARSFRCGRRQGAFVLHPVLECAAGGPVLPLGQQRRHALQGGAQPGAADARQKRIVWRHVGGDQACGQARGASSGGTGGVEHLDTPAALR